MIESLQSRDERKCIAVPMLDEWYDIRKGESPESGESVMAFCHFNGASAVCQVDFFGNANSPSFRLGVMEVTVTHWLHVGAVTQADRC